MKRIALIFALFISINAIAQNNLKVDKVIIYFKTSYLPVGINSNCDINSNSIRVSEYSYKFEAKGLLLDEMKKVFLNFDNDSLFCSYCWQLEEAEPIIVVDFISNSEIRKSISFVRNFQYFRDDGRFGDYYYKNEEMVNWFKEYFPFILKHYGI
ncbi:MAG: hypothetical protein PHV76_04105 [Bacteroidales bacterium]|nr:hypothetical protein [Bacteroidales bacterium]